MKAQLNRKQTQGEPKIAMKQLATLKRQSTQMSIKKTNLQRQTTLVS